MRAVCWHLAQYDLYDVKELADEFKEHVRITTVWSSHISCSRSSLSQPHDLVESVVF